jgi:hypothetical protein
MYKREHNIQVCHKEKGCEIVAWIHLAQDRSSERSNEPLGSKIVEFMDEMCNYHLLKDCAPWSPVFCGWMKLAHLLCISLYSRPSTH